MASQAADDRLAHAQTAGVDLVEHEPVATVAHERAYLAALHLDVHRHLVDPGVAGGVVGGLPQRGDERLEARLHGAVAHHHEVDPHRSEEHTSELQSLMRISYAVFCLKKKNTYTQSTHNTELKNNTPNK